jgi:hypothetical protein
MSSSAAAAPFRVEGKQRAPINKSLPKITGTATEGQRLTASTGSWSGSPTSFAYSWQRCNASGANCLGAGAITSTYDLSAADVGSTIRVVVTARNTGGSTSASSLPTALVKAQSPPPSPPVNTSAPTVSGSTKEGGTVSVSAGTWSGSPTSYTYQWRVCDGSGASCSDLSGATSFSYLITANEVGKTLRAVVTAKNAAGSASASSAASAAVTESSTPLSANCTLYAAPNGSTSNSGTAPGSPLTLVSAASKVVPGSVVCLLPGTYTLTSPLYLSKGGTESAYVVFRSEGGNVLLTSNFSTPDEIIQVQTTAAYVEFRGLSFDGKGTNATSAIHIKDHSHHIRIVDNVIANMGAGGILTSNTDYVTCVDNQIYRFGDGVGWGSGISLNSGAGAWWFDSQPGFHNIIADNFISGGVDNSSNHTDGNGIILDLGGAIPPTLITGNVVYMNGGRGIESYETTGAVFVVNNTLYKNGLDLRESGIGDLVANTVTNQVWANNVVLSWEPRYSYQLLSGSSSIAFFRNGKHGGLGTQNVSSNVLSDPTLLRDSDPFFVAPPAVDPSADGQWGTAPSPVSLGNALALAPGSPFVDTGIDPRTMAGLTPEMSSAIDQYAMHAVDGTPRPAGGGFDSGAYER